MKGKPRKDADHCEKCGEIVPIGGWAWCVSRRNPEGHARGAYRFSVSSGMVQHKWQRMGK